MVYHQPALVIVSLSNPQKNNQPLRAGLEKVKPDAPRTAVTGAPIAVGALRPRQGGPGVGRVLVSQRNQSTSGALSIQCIVWGYSIPPGTGCQHGNRPGRGLGIIR